MSNPAGGRSRTPAPAPFRPKRGRPSADQTAAISRAILDAATELFLAQGFEGTAMEAVAARAGVPKSTLYNRFADKKALLGAVLEARVSAWSAVASRKNWMLTEDLEQRLKQYAAWMFTWATSPEVRAFADLAASVWSAADERGCRLDVVGFSEMAALLERDIRGFGPRAGIQARDPARVAMSLMALLSGWLDLRASREPVREDEAASVAAWAVDLIMRGAAAW